MKQPLSLAGGIPCRALLNGFLSRFVHCGRLRVIYPDGSQFDFGDEASTAPPIVARFTSWRLAALVALHPDRYLGEGYMNGVLRIEQGDLWGLLDLCGRNIAAAANEHPVHWLKLPKAVARWFQQLNSQRTSRRNVAHHYDLSPALYRSFLDEDLQYSCAYFRSPTLGLDVAQQEKKYHIAAKLLLKPGQTVLDIGCGWGGLALTLARAENVRVVGITLSTEQLAIARRRATEAGLADRVSFELRDYREISEQYDRVVSVGMFEHVGTPHYADFFQRVFRLLKPEGVALLHSIGRMHGPDVTSAWIRKYIFPGGYIPALSQVMPAIENAGLWLTDLEVLRLHYASTLRAWRERFLAGADHLEAAYDDRFKRMWEFYLAVSEMSFRYAGMMVFQVQLAKRVDGVPTTRDYIMGEELHFSRPLAAE
jgi:cyclopropane-fatty-acyl-phospholipid synthase